MPPLSPQALPDDVSFMCPACGKTLKAQATLAGQRGKCTGCGAPVVVPPRFAELPVPPPVLLPADPLEQQVEDVRGAVQSLGLSSEGQEIVDDALDRQREAMANPGNPLATILWVLFWSIVAAVSAGLFGWDRGRPNPSESAVRVAVLALLFGGGTWVVLWKVVYEGEYYARRRVQRERRRRGVADRQSSACPRCHAPNGGELVSRERFETGEVGYVTQHQTVPVTDTLGNVTHYEHRPTRVPFNKAVVREVRRCRHCEHTWAHDEAQLPFL